MSCKCTLRKKVNLFYVDGRFCDVVVEVQKRTFKCHRIVLASVSDYFDALFRNKLNECSDQRTVLHDISPEDFEEILEFAYTEKKPSITDGNVFDLLRASDFLGMHILTNHCVTYISKMAPLIENVLEVYFFAHTINNERLAEIMCDCIIEEFYTVSQKEEFLTMSFRELKAILKNYQSRGLFNPSVSSMFRNEDWLLNTLIRWVNHSTEERSRYCADLFQIVDFSKISSKYLKFLTEKFKMDGLVNDVVSLQKYLCGYFSSNHQDNDHFLVTTPMTCGSVSKARLYVYVDYLTESDACDEALNVFSTCRYQSKWSFSGRKCPSPFSYWDGVTKIITMDGFHNCLYSLYLPDSVHDEPTFSTFTSPMLDSGKRLASPPAGTPFTSFDMCGYQNSIIYVYKWDEETSYRYSEVHQYVCQLDRWFPVVGMWKDFIGACMVTDNNLLYFINEKYVVAYDYRMPNWFSFPRTNEPYRRPVATSLNGKIYVSDGHNVEVLDPVAGKWETVYHSISSKKALEWDREKYILAYEDKLWLACSTKTDFNHLNSGNDNVVNLDTYNRYIQDYFIQVIDPRDRTSQTSRLLNEIVVSHTEYETCDEGRYYDSFRFPGKKYHGLFYPTTNLNSFISF